MKNANGSFKVKKVTVNNQNVFHINWEGNPVDVNVYGKINRYVRRSTNYAQFNTRKRLQFRKFLNDVNELYNTSTTLEQALSIRNIVLKDKIIKNYARMNQNISKISKEYSTTGIVKLSMVYDFPPLNLLRGILLHRGYDAHKVYLIFANKDDPKILLHGRDLQQYNTALENDAESTFNQQHIAAIAAQNEDLAVDYFRSLGIELKTQNDLTEEQMKEHGRAVITPDILFLDKVIINGIAVKWIDYKDYIGTSVRFLYASNLNQASRYVEKWGPGAFCYRYDHIDGVIVPSCLLLSGESLPINYA
jgi:hypothetical protein